MSERPTPGEKDQRRWATVSFKLPREIAAELEKALMVAQLGGCRGRVEAVEMIAAEFLSTWLPQWEQQGEAMQATELGRVRWEVLNRDEWKCKRCDSMRDLHVHHVVPRSASKAGILDPENCITLCARCHEDHHQHR